MRPRACFTPEIRDWHNLIMAPVPPSPRRTCGSRTGKTSLRGLASHGTSGEMAALRYAHLTDSTTKNMVPFTGSVPHHRRHPGGRAQLCFLRLAAWLIHGSVSVEIPIRSI